MDDLIQLSASASHEKKVEIGALTEVEAIPRAFTIYHLQGIFLFSAGGFMLALFALFGEILIVQISTSSFFRCFSG